MAINVKGDKNRQIPLKLRVLRGKENCYTDREVVPELNNSWLKKHLRWNARVFSSSGFCTDRGGIP